MVRKKATLQYLAFQRVRYGPSTVSSDFIDPSLLATSFDSDVSNQPNDIATRGRPETPATSSNTARERTASEMIKPLVTTPKAPSSFKPTYSTPESRLREATHPDPGPSRNYVSYMKWFITGESSTWFVPERGNGCSAAALVCSNAPPDWLPRNKRWSALDLDDLKAKAPIG